ncbi:hypothetical protein B0O99DRAFT_64405 [Bisporella sp. PMI_857]|nr:hypothetical protein B0O99DRAFT_64405 [Bisporella sp. PMI_857]
MEDLELMMSQRVEASTRLSYSPSRAEHPQTESPFFARLPLEIRVLIYKDIIASWGWHSDAVHIIAQNQLELPPIAPWEISTTTPTPNSKLVCTPCAAVFGDPFLISGTHYGSWPKGHLACSRIASWRQNELHTLEAQYHIEKFRPLKAQVGVPRLEE